MLFFFFKQKTAYEMRISDWSSDVCSSDLHDHVLIAGFGRVGQTVGRVLTVRGIPWIALDRSPRLVAEHRRQGRSVFYGDAARADVLHAAGDRKSTRLNSSH